MKKLIAILVGILVAVLAYTELSKPTNLADCFLKVSQEATTEKGVMLGMGACKSKFGTN